MSGLKISHSQHDLLPGANPVCFHRADNASALWR